MGHDHGPGDGAHPPTSPRVRRLLAASVLPFLAAALLGLVALWPHEPARSGPAFDAGSQLFDGQVEAVTSRSCEIGTCTELTVRLAEGPEAGTTQTLRQYGVGAQATNPEVGDGVVLSRTEIPGQSGPVYNFADFQRRGPMIWLLALFVAATILVGRRSGAGALVGLGASYVLLAVFAIPAILVGHDPMLVALVSGTLIMFAVLYLASGINARVTTALLGTLVAIGFTALLAKLFVTVTNLTGLSSEESAYLQTQTVRVSPSAVILAGIVIGTLGALNDVTVTQASAVWEIHGANPSLGRTELYKRGMRVGRDHIASTIDTLVLAYAGASLPLLLLFSLSSLPFARVATGEIVGAEIIRALVGSLGLIASVPITTFVAALVVSADRGGDAAAPDHADEGAAPTGARTGPAPDPRPRPVRLRGEGADDARGTRGARDARDARDARAARDARRRERAESWRPPKAERDFRDD